jgi:hypothetical protein
MSLLVPIARRWRCLPDIKWDKTVRLIKSWEGKFASISFILEPSYQSKQEVRNYLKKFNIESLPFAFGPPA